MALAAYRNLLRSTRIAFQGLSFLPLVFASWKIPYPNNINSGDATLLHAARSEARNHFRKNASLQANDPVLAAAVKHAEEVAQILRQNVVQGKKMEGEDDRYSMFLRLVNRLSLGKLRRSSCQTLICARVELRIHEHTERGDNDSVKMPNGQKVVIDGKTCADR